MDLRLTLVDPAGPPGGVDVVVSAAPGTPLGAVRPQLEQVLRQDGAQAWCGGVLDDGVVLGLPPLLQGAVLALRAPGAPADARLHAVGLELHVQQGPDAGRVLSLPPGTSVVGRDPSAPVRIGDPEVSRAHARLEVGASTVVVSDLGSANGTTVDGAPADGARATIGARITMGATTVVLRRADEAVPAAVVPDGLGHLLLNRAPRTRTPAAGRSFTEPSAPQRHPPHRPSWLMMLVPLLVAVPLAVLWSQPAFLLLAAASPLAAAVQHVVDRRGGRRREARDTARHAADLVAHRDRVTQALAEDLRRLEADLPDLPSVLRAAATPSTLVWQRRPEDADLMAVRLGRGRVSARVEVRDDSGVVHQQVHADAPVGLDLRSAVVTGVAGPSAEVLGVARSVVAQVAVHCSPAQVRLGVLTDEVADGHDWDWVRRLPHHDAPSTWATPDGTRSGSAGAAPARLVVLDGAAALRRRPDVAALLARAADDGLVLLCLDRDRASLPGECSVVVETDSWGGLSVHRSGAAADEEVRCESAGLAWARSVARALEPLRDATPAAASGLPDQVGLAEVLRQTGGPDPVDAGSILDAWRARPRRPATPLGVTALGPWTVDLAADGPHALVAGTTGAGKSALLRSLVTGLAVVNRPDELVLVLVDYKGGAAFAGCAALPHVAGVVTDLDPAGTARALTSLRAELRRRERMLRAAGLPDADAYAAARARGTGLPALPRLVLVVDELAVLAEELPEFVDGLVRLAAVGRSLGVHLVLATQRPAGVVSADIRANTSLRVALRVRDATDSLDVVEAPDAAALPHDRPGRAVVRGGDGRLVAVQVARLAEPGATERGATEPGATEPLPPRVRLVVPDRPAGGTPGQGPLDDGAAGRGVVGGPLGATDDEVALARIAAAVTEATRRSGATVPPPPWLPELPHRVRLASLLGASGTAAPPGTLLLGLADHPQEQRQLPWGWDLFAREHLAVAGGPRSGRTTALLTAAWSAAGVADVYAVDPSGGLGVTAWLAQVGAVAAADDVERCGRLLDHLADRAAAGRAGRGAGPRPAVLLVDGWDSVVGAWTGSRLEDAVLSLLRDGPAGGVLLAVAGGRTLLSGPVAALLGRRLLLPTADPLDATLAGVAARDVPRHRPPGRALLLGGDGVVQVQLAVPDLAADGTDDVGGATTGGTASARWAAAAAAPGTPAATPIPALPTTVGLPDRPAPPPTGGTSPTDDPPRTDGPTPPSDAHSRGDDVPSGRLRTQIGVGPDRSGTALEPVHVTLRPPGLLVVGAPGSGRSTALATLARGLEAAGRKVVTVTGGRPGLQPITEDADVIVVDGLACLPQVHEDYLISLLDGPPGTVVVASCGPADVARAYRGLLGRLRETRCGLVLGAVPAMEVDWLGVRLPPTPARTAGRGWLVEDGVTRAVQVAVADAVDLPGAGSGGLGSTGATEIDSTAAHRGFTNLREAGP